MTYFVNKEEEFSMLTLCRAGRSSTPIKHEMKKRRERQMNEDRMVKYGLNPAL